MNKQDYIECIWLALDEYERGLVEGEGYAQTRIDETRAWLRVIEKGLLILDYDN